MKKVRQALYDRLAFFDFTDEQLKDKSLFALISLQTLLVGGGGFIGNYTTTCRTLISIFGEDAFYNEPTAESSIEEKPKLAVVVH